MSTEAAAVVRLVGGPLDGAAVSRSSLLLDKVGGFTLSYSDTTVTGQHGLLAWAPWGGTRSTRYILPQSGIAPKGRAYHFGTRYDEFA